MNGVGSIGSEGFYYRVPKATKPAQTRATTNQPWRRIGMEEALKLSGRYLTAALNDAGFVDMHAGAIERMEMYIKHQTAQNEPPEIGLDPATAAEIAAYMGSQIASEMNQVQRILARIDPARVAALLK